MFRKRYDFMLLLRYLVNSFSPLSQRTQLRYFETFLSRSRTTQSFKRY